MPRSATQRTRYARCQAVPRWSLRQDARRELLPHIDTMPTVGEETDDKMISCAGLSSMWRAERQDQHCGVAEHGRFMATWPRRAATMRPSTEGGRQGANGHHRWRQCDGPGTNCERRPGPGEQRPGGVEGAEVVGDGDLDAIDANHHTSQTGCLRTCVVLQHLSRA